MTITYHRMPLLLHLYHLHVRRTPGVWMGVPWGVLVPRNLWDGGLWAGKQYAPLRAHEEKHVGRICSRPFLSRWGWTVRYMLSWRMRLDEETVSLCAQIPLMAPADVRPYVEWFVRALVTDYGVKLPVDEVMKRVMQVTGPLP